MSLKKTYLLPACLVLAPLLVRAQANTNLRQRYLFYSQEAVRLDTLSIIPGSEILSFPSGEVADSSFYTLDPLRSSVIFKKSFEDSLRISYRVFPYDFYRPFYRKEYKRLEPDASGIYNPFVYKASETAGEDVFGFGGLNKNGSISRGINFGNNQDLSFNSNLNLQLSGKVSENINVLAAITDDNIPIQPEGNTQQLQEFDQVYIQLFDDRSKLIAGDFQLSRPNSHFMNFYKRALGGSFTTSFHTRPPLNDTTPAPLMKIAASGAVSKGKFSRNIIQGIEGNQGPYRLKGAENELFIIVLSGTERVFIDGVLQTRGQEYDYVIDYNTAEITFTARQLITKDKRIIVEFQYSDKNYARSLFHLGDEYETARAKLRVNFYSEQDSKNQPLQQDLTEEKKMKMAEAGDSLNYAVFPTARPEKFSEDLVLYQLTDTILNGIIFDSIYVYSTNPENAFYAVSFSFVGEGQGNYRQVSSTANGKVFEWTAPLNGIKQGSYEPVTLLVTPKKRQMVTVGSDYFITPATRSTVEFALSNNDINTFSDLHSRDDQDIAFLLHLENTKKLSRHQDGWRLTSAATYEQVNKNFTPIERFRSVEFERDWNIIGRTLTKNQQLPALRLTLTKNKLGFIAYGAEAFNASDQYSALKNSLGATLNFNRYEIITSNSYLVSEGFDNSTAFLRQRAKISRRFNHFTVGIWEDQEDNRQRGLSDDTLLPSSYSYFEWESFISNPDTSKNRYRLSYRQRYDNAAKANRLERVTRGESVSFDFGLNQNPNSMLNINNTYRKLHIINSELTSQKAENTLLTRVEYALRLAKGTFSFNTFYEIGSGLEARKEFSFLQVPAGQGAYAYIGDFNENGVKDLNEFEISPFPDRAEYIKVFTPTNDYVKVYSSQFSQSLNINPAAAWGGKTGLKKFIGRFSNQTAFRVERKTNREDRLGAFNPFITEVADSSLITLHSSLRNTVFFNRADPKFGLDYTWQGNSNKTLLVNGFDSRKNILHNARARWNVTRSFMLGAEGTLGEKSDSSAFLLRNYKIVYTEGGPVFTWQPSTSFRTAVTYKHKEKHNKYGGEKLSAQNIGVETRYSVLSKGTLSFNMNFIQNSYTGESNSAVSFEMLEGLQPGKNITWGASFQQNLSKNMQLSLNYTGRTSETAPPVHTGGVQVRAFF